MELPTERFLPHDVLSVKQPSPVQLGCEEPALQEGLLINHPEEIPYFRGRFDRVAESSCKIKYRKEEFAINSTVIGVTLPSSIKSMELNIKQRLPT